MLMSHSEPLDACVLLMGVLAPPELFTELAMIFTARLLIRLASLMPEAFNLRQTAEDLEALAILLQKGIRQCLTHL